MRCFCQLSVNVVIQKSEALMKSSSSATLLMSADIELCIQLCQQAISEGSGLSSEFIKLSGDFNHLIHIPPYCEKVVNKYYIE